MAIRTFGEISVTQSFTQDVPYIHILKCEPHVSIKLKSVFHSIRITSTPPYEFDYSPQNCTDLLWFIQRYPMQCDKQSMKLLKLGEKNYNETRRALEEIMMPDFIPAPANLKDGEQARHYQLTAAAVIVRQERILLGDEMGLGKTLTAIICMLKPENRPALVVVQTHLPLQWKEDQIERFSDLKVHIIKGTKPYDLKNIKATKKEKTLFEGIESDKLITRAADVYIISYSCLAGWVDVFSTGFFKFVVFDEIQELRTGEGSNKYWAARVASNNAKSVLGMSGTPIYNYGDEIYHILNLVKPMCLGPIGDFCREWCSNYGRHIKVKDTKALGSYLRENFLFLRRTRAEVGRELPPVNKIVTTVNYDDDELTEMHKLAEILATKYFHGSSPEIRGQAGMELDIMARAATGRAKAREVAALVKMIVENGEPVLLAGWHRDVYTVWLEVLAEYNPVMYTGTESPKQKREAIKKFCDKESMVFIISNRSGIGIDGLQKVCSNVVHGELDYSPQVHEQIRTRIDRDGQLKPVTQWFPVCDEGSDPPMVNILGLKASQAKGIIDPLKGVTEQFTDESRVKALAKYFLEKKHS